jgi:DNA-binding IclR family transcriptional regulator
VERSLAILSSFSRERPERTLEGISDSIGLPKSTTHRLLATLIAGGFVDRGHNASTYRLGLSVATLGSVAIRSRRPREDAHRTLERLRAEYDETIGLSIRNGRSVVIVDKVESRHPLRYDLSIGTSLPAHCTSAGKVLLSGMTNSDIVSVYGDERLSGGTGNAIKSTSELLAEIEKVRRVGFAIDDEELAHGVRCVGVPVWGATGQIEYALGVSGPTARLSLDRLRQLVPPLKDASNEIMSYLALPDADSVYQAG